MTLDLKNDAEVEVVADALVFEHDMIGDLGWTMTREQQDAKRKALNRIFKRLTGKTIKQYQNE